MSRTRPAPMPRAGEAAARDRAPRVGLERGIALGYLALLPLVCLYEVAIAHAQDAPRNVGEVVLSAPLVVFGGAADQARWALLALLACAAAWSTFDAELGLLRRVWRIALEGLLCALVLGPLLIVLVYALGADLDLARLRAPPPGSAALLRAALLAGGAAYEEIVFRVGLISLLFVLARPIVRLIGFPERLARPLAEALALVAAAVVFAAAHLAYFLQAIGPGGERYDPAVFTWRVLAGILLGCLFRWRGPGVTAWTHALFNLALLIGAGPDVFL